MIKRSFSIVCFVVLCIVSAFSQEKIYNFLHFTVKEGLPSNVIRSVAQDKRGLIWVTTNKGLSYFDGKRFYDIKFDSKNQYLSNDFGAISIAHDNTIWLTTNNQGLFCYNPTLPLEKSLTQYNAVNADNMLKHELYDVYVARSGLVYFGGQETDLQILNPKDSSVKTVRLSENRRSSTIYNITEGEDGTIWLGMRFEGLINYNPNSGVIKKYNLNNSGENGVSAMISIGDTLFASYYDYDLISLNNLSNKIESTELLKLGKNVKYYDNFISAMTYWKDQQLIIAGHVSEGLYLYDIRSKLANKISWNEISPNSGNGRRIHDIYINSQGYFLATEDGLFFYSNEFNKVQQIIREADDPILHIVNVEGKKVYITKKEIGEVKGNYRERINRVSLQGLNISAVHVAGSIVYLSTYDRGVFLYNSKNKTLSPLAISGEKYGFEKADCNTVLQDKFEPILWIGSWNSGLYKYNILDNKIKLYAEDQGLIDHKIIQLIQGNDGTLWLGTDGAGLISFDKRTDRFTNYIYSNKLTSVSSNTIYSFLTDSRNNIWYGSSHSGLGKIEGTKGNYHFEKIIDRYPDSWAYVRKLQEDSQNNIWMTTGDGVMIFHPKDSSFLQLKPNEGVYPPSHYRVNDFYLDHNQVYWLTDQGIIYGKYYNEYVSSISNIKPILSSFKIFNNDKSYLLFGDKIQLESSENSFSISFSSNELVNNETLVFAYKLEGIDADWIKADESLQANYTNLTGGSYVFRVKVGNVNGKWSKHTVETPIHLKINWYDTIYFKVFLAILFFLIIIGFLVFRIRQQRKINSLQKVYNNILQKELRLNEVKIKEQAEILEFERKEKLESSYKQRLFESELKAIRSQMNPHFIFNVLNSIEAYVVENDSKSASIIIHKFATLSRLVLENSNESLVTLGAEVHLVKLYLELEQERFGDLFDYEINFENGKALKDKKIPSMLLQPIVENAVHHGVRHLVDRKGKILISIKDLGKQIQIEVLDNGVGFQKQKKDWGTRKTSFGLKGIEDRIYMINMNASEVASLQIEEFSAPNLFTVKVSVTLPNWS